MTKEMICRHHETLRPEKSLESFCFKWLLPGDAHPMLRETLNKLKITSVLKFSVDTTSKQPSIVLAYLLPGGFWAELPVTTLLMRVDLDE